MTTPPRRDLSVLDARGTGRPVSRRRPLTRPMPRTWFLRTPEFRWYALREVSSLAVGLSVVHLAGAVVAINRGLDAWERWLAFQRHPAMVAVTAFVLVMAVVHAVTWFHVSPAIVRVRIGRRLLPGAWAVAAQYAAALGILAALIWWIARGTS